MEALKKRIIEDGHALSENVLKVDSFLNHQVDVKLMQDIGKNFKENFKDKGITKVFTIESSGIAPAAMTALQLEVPLVILKKQASKILNEEVYQTTVHSFTKDLDYQLTLSQKFITKEDKILFIDDFLANGQAALGVINIIEEAGAKLNGIGIVIEKSFQPGRKKLENIGYEVYSLARVSKLAKGIIEFL
ncbi:xanthine phosphoribosyltransferase [Clostridium sp. 19966]|uniref:xanthine phosphoribosyltransferase n=1 Tax=Clostridium sp. 19966 TaxID=2768166 RepID=UPI0028DD6259|nr:xanthine phosphoribosyltransferase [Clostridium sp. 19966]MDT8719245.1 xanthine phosphoribosyltransferase [Clostridium sp. 19966]